MENRRSFLKKAGMGSALLGISGTLPFCGSIASSGKKNKLPRWRGFNVTDFMSSRPITTRQNSRSTPEDHFKWMSDWGFDFVRIPAQYPGYIKFDSGPDRSKRITPEEVLDFNDQAIEQIENMVYLANKYNLHVSFSLHRVPGFCVNAGFYEPYNLWKDEEAQKALYAHWEMWAKRFKNASEKKVSFDLINEPCWRDDMNDQFGPKTALPGDLYRKVVKGCVDVIHEISPKRLIVADGNNKGGSVCPELVDLNVAQSCRGYNPGAVSHYRASWVWKNPDDAPMPVWPGTIDGKYYDRQYLEEYYEPWVKLMEQGVGVHCGECGCYRETPHNVALAWMNDMLGVLTENGIGYAFWNFRGDFGILDSGRKDVEYEDWYGHKLDRKLLALLQKY